MKVIEFLKCYWEALIAASALMISLVSLIVSIVSVRNQRKSAERQQEHFIMTVRPHLDLYVDTKGEDGLWKVLLKNTGNGPAVLEKAMLYDTKTKLEIYPTAFALNVLRQYDPKAGGLLATKGMVIAKGQEFELMYFRTGEGFEGIVNVFERYHVKYGYTDLYVSDHWESIDDFVKEARDQSKRL